MPGFAPLPAVPLASGGLPPSRKVLFARVFVLNIAAEGRTEALAMSLARWSLMARHRAKPQRRHLPHDTGVLSAVSIYEVVRTATLKAAASNAEITVYGDAALERVNTGRVTGD